ncbi:LOW QUALITY PROTEIN: cell division protein FtsI [Geomicrobium sp. JCM 19038]|nr:LOW QUALITY PROTEIN: cell division protein FtsI [Geomicrobium sp. JCM 19038]
MGQPKRKNHIPYRLNVLFFGVFVLFSILILRLGYVQIVQGDSYDLMLSQEEEQTATVDAPRGIMFDRNNYVLVDNDMQLSLTYTNRPGNEQERYEIAHQLVNYLEVDEEDVEEINDREWQDYFLYEASIEEREEDGTLADGSICRTRDERRDFYRRPKSKYLYKTTSLRCEEIRESYSLEEQQAVVIWREMLSGYNHSPNRIARGLSEEQAHHIGEVLHTMPGTDLMRDAERVYPYGEQFASFFGSVGSIPAELVDGYLGKGYERSDAVGTSYLEQEYEDLLRGEKAIMTTLPSGDVEMQEGRRGNDLRLTLDMRLQQEVDAMVTRRIDGYGGYAFPAGRDAYVVMIEPSTGDILALVGYQGHLGTVNNSYTVGSSIKPATVLAGYRHGAIGHGSVIHDSPITHLPNTPSISSVVNMGYVNDIDAIRRSSNVYMAEIAMRLAGYNRSNNTWNTLSESYNMLREHYAQFGLGASTGIDLPFESEGITGPNTAGMVLLLSFGQYDDYTPLQLGQYTATLANDGVRMRTRLVRDVLEPGEVPGEAGGSIRYYEPEVLNTVDNPIGDINRMQTAMRQVVSVSGQGGGTANRELGSFEYQAAGKTGTAQVQKNGIRLNNQTMVAYAPYDNPEVAVAVVVPNVTISRNREFAGIANNIAREAMEIFFEQKESHQAPELAEVEDMDIDPDDTEG